MSDELEELVSDVAIQDAWFGVCEENVDRRGVIFDTLMKYAGDFSSGHTATSICAELGLLLGHKKGCDITLSKKGRRYLYYATKHALRAMSRPTPTPSQVESDTIERCAEMIASDGLEYICECIGAPADYNNGKEAFRQWAYARIRNLPRKWEK